MIHHGILRTTGVLVCVWCFVVLAPVLYAEERLAGELVIEGTGDSQALLRELATHFETQYPGTTIQVPDSIGSSGGIKAVGSGQIELGRVARPIKEEEESYGLAYTAFAISPIVLIIHPSVEGIDNLTTEQIVGIYSGTIIDWQQLGGTAHKLYPIGREAGDSSRLVLEAYIPTLQDIRTSAAKVYYTTPEAIEAIVEHEYTLGYVPAAMLKNRSVRMMRVDGIAPSIENIRQHRYAMVTTFGMVYKEPLSPLAEAFVDFLFSQEAREIIEQYGCAPVEPEKRSG